eukprot:scaffold4031_cov135-Cylindrotheca_fusiformis.AAC.10
MVQFGATKSAFLFLCFVLLGSNDYSATEALNIAEHKIRAISFDVTGTLLASKEPVIKTYYDAAIWSRFPNPPPLEELKKGFKKAYKERCIESPCFGGNSDDGRGSGREWWIDTLQLVLEYAGRKAHVDYTQEEFDRFFRRVYQQFGSSHGYMVLDDAETLISSLSSSSSDVLMGITSNTPTRYMDSVLPMLDNLHDHFRFFTCSQDVGHEKPAPEIFEATYQEAKFWMPDLQKDQVLHIGDSLACDYCGAKAYGFQAILLDRSDHPKVTAYQTWIDAPNYPGKSEEDIDGNTITSLEEVTTLLTKATQQQ